MNQQTAVERKKRKPQGMFPERERQKHSSCLTLPHSTANASPSRVTAGWRRQVGECFKSDRTRKDAIAPSYPFLLSQEGDARGGHWALQHTRLLCPPLSPGVGSNSCPVTQWCYLTISSSATPFFFYLQFFPASESFSMSQLFTSGGQSIGASTSATDLPMNIQASFYFLCFWRVKLFLKHSTTFFPLFHTFPPYYFLSSKLCQEWKKGKVCFYKMCFISVGRKRDKWFFKVGIFGFLLLSCKRVFKKYLFIWLHQVLVATPRIFTVASNS